MIERRKLELESSIRKRLSLQDLLHIHRDAKTFSQETCLQILEKHYDPTTSKLSSVTLSDGAFVSSNVVPKDDKAAENLNRIDRFALVQIDQARVKCDKVVVDGVDILEISSKEGEVINLKKAYLGEGIEKLKRIGADSMSLWGLKFMGGGQEVEFGARKAGSDQNATISKVDSVLEEVGNSSKGSEPEPASTEPRSKRKRSQCPFCVRTFSDTEALVKHVDCEHND